MPPPPPNMDRVEFELHLLSMLQVRSASTERLFKIVPNVKLAVKHVLAEYAHQDAL